MRLALLLPLAPLLVGCGSLRSPAIDTTAIVRAATVGCELIVEGLFPDMAHDPISLVFSGRSKLVANISVPSLHGEFDGSQVRVQYRAARGSPWGGNSSLAGKVVFESNRVQISLFHVIEGQKPNPMLFNGSFTLSGTTSCPANS